MSVILHGAGYSVYVRIARLALIEKGIAHEHREVDIFAEGGPPPDHLERHPFGKIPALEHDGFVLYETTAICRYADEAFDGPALMPDDTRDRARAAQVVAMLDSYGYPSMVWQVFVPLSTDGKDEGHPDLEVVALGMERASIVLSELERMIEEGRVLDGRRIGLADLHAVPILAYFMATEPGRESVARHPRLSAWVAAMRERPSVVATRPPEAAW